MQEKPNFYAVLPASVRYDTRLRPAARLLYAEITALCNKSGYCTAGNSYFCKIYQTTDRSIRGWIQQLVDCGYIRSQIIRDDSGEVKERRIFITSDPPEKIFRTYGKISPDPMEKNFRNNNRKNITSKNNIPPISPEGGQAEEQHPVDDIFVRYANGNAELLTALNDFTAHRVKMRAAMTDRAKELLLKRLDRITNIPEVKIEMLENAILMGWKSVYAREEREVRPKSNSKAPDRKETREL